MSFMSKLSEFVCIHKLKTISVIYEDKKLTTTSMCLRCGMTKKQVLHEAIEE